MLRLIRVIRVSKFIRIVIIRVSWFIGIVRLIRVSGATKVIRY